ncbi:MAG TPA: hypothetical protein PKO27_17550 [Deltaproteobacteria bacterium]|nr:hypothetical protein [Deltaproteobacteria bacterium]
MTERKVTEKPSSKEMEIHTLLYSWAERTGLKRVSDRHGLSRRLNDLAISLLDIAQDVRFSLFQRRFDRSGASGGISAAILTVDPSSYLEQCLESIRKQTLAPSRVEVIRNVTPFSKASQEALDRIETEYYVQVDEDMVLKPTCFERLYFLMMDDPACAQSVADLEDPVFGRITGIKMYRTGPVRSIGFHPFQDEKGCERFMTRELSNKGFATLRTRSIQGMHHPSYTQLDIFWKFHFIGEQLRYYQQNPRVLSDYLEILARRWQRHHDTLAIFGLAGLFSGLQTDAPSLELDYANRKNSLLFQKMKDIIDNIDDVHPG